MRYSKIVLGVLLSSAMLVSCGGDNYKEITIDEAKDLVKANLEKDAGYTGGESVTKVIKSQISLNAPEEVLQGMTEEEFIDATLGGMDIPEEGSEEKETIAAGEVDYLRVTEDQILTINSNDSASVKYYVSGDSLRIEVDMNEENTETQAGMTMTMKISLKQVYEFDDYGYVVKEKDSETAEVTMTMGDIVITINVVAEAETTVTYTK